MYQTTNRVLAICFLDAVFGKWQIQCIFLSRCFPILEYLGYSNKIKNTHKEYCHKWKCKVFETMKVQVSENCTWFFAQCLHTSTLSYKGRQEALTIKTKYQKRVWKASAIRIWSCDETMLRTFSAVFHTSASNAIHQERLIAEDNIATSKQDLPFLL